MDNTAFVQTVKILCAKKGVKPTVACREAGVGTSFITDLNRGRVPSVEKVQLIAKYLGVTTSELLGEVGFAAASGLTATEIEIALAYRRATPDRKQIVDLALGEHESTTSNVG